MEIRTILGSMAVVVGLIGYIPYIRDIFAGRTKPHSFSWFVWVILTGTAFFGQIVDGGGAGAWVTGTTSIACLTIFLLSLKRGERNIVLFDKISLAGALVAIIFWIITKTPLISVILITIIDFLAFLPTIRKSFSKPSEETRSTYFWNGLGFLIGVFSLEKISIITALYPSFLVVANMTFIIMLTVRRKQLGIV